jgi:hypothetical protein
MRAEVALLTRNIMIDASTIEEDNNEITLLPWQCRVLVSDFFEPDFTLRQGNINFDHVEIKGCG